MNSVSLDVHKRLGPILEALQRLPDVEAVMLFGSQATGKAAPISDIDICVITPRNSGLGKKLASHGWKDVDVVWFWDLPLTIQFRVFKEGVPLFTRRNKKVESVSKMTRMMYYDFAWIRNRHIEEALA